MTTPKPVILCILDGWGLRAERKNNAVALSNTPTYDRLMKDHPNATLKTSGLDVGLPEGQMGNSEVGHMNIGAGRVVSMDLGRIDLAIDDGSLSENEALLKFIAKLQESGGSAHLIGLTSNGGVHAHIDHMIAVADIIAATGIEVKIHALTDGRDVAPGSARNDLKHLESILKNKASIVSVIGRFFAMDRDSRWQRVQSAYSTMVHGEGTRVSAALEAVQTALDNGETDEFISPTVVGDYQGMEDGDGVLCLNFRADRAREIMAALGDPEFSRFDICRRPELATMAGLVSYSDEHDEYMDALFPKKHIVNTLGHWAAEHGLRQYRLAETEKYPHVTFFMNGGEEVPDVGEVREMPASPKVATYDLKPEMSLGEVTEKLVQAIEAQYDLIIVNFANPDMVGHTGDLQAAIDACEAVDQGLSKALSAIEKTGGAMIVTADHGNCETMVDPETGKPHTAHTTNTVPVILFGGAENVRLRKDGRLADLAPTLLQLLDLPAPIEMTGQSLIAG